MAKSKKQEALEASRRRQIQIMKWHAGGRDPKEAKRLGIMEELYADQVSKEEMKECGQQALELEVEPLQQQAVKIWNDDKRTARELGRVLNKVQDVMIKMGRGAFQKWWTSAGMEKNRVYYCMRLVSPKGDKVKESKDRRRRSPKAVAFSLINEKLSKLWKLAEGNETQEAKVLFDQIIAEIKERFIAKPKAMAASA
jgi:hypothetical protein